MTTRRNTAPDTAGINRSNTAARAVLEQPCLTGGRTETVRPKREPTGRTDLSNRSRLVLCNRSRLVLCNRSQELIGQACPTRRQVLWSDSACLTTGRTRLFEHRSNCRVRPVNAGSRQLTGMADHQTAATGDQNREPTAEPAGSTPSGTANQNKHVDRSSSYREWFRVVLRTQRKSLLQAQDNRHAAREEREAASARIAQLEEAMILMAMKLETTKQNPAPPTDRVDLQKFRTSDGPTFHGPFQEVKLFLRWIKGVQIFFDTKGVNDSADKIRIVGSLIGETNLLAFYANESRKFINKPWEDFQA
ncbi:hypothetical protein PCANC_20661 [Puccinia coronata f. sp. avenae]|uniref:Uncharacterized protein n=1 Tax=Puccinia coronata f. sp. avenae TaxID=200324 RepID=A0A2N5UQ03_9BASI|nr:hypothetical protein PCANC_20661 [Puccinia coronata f. sp. avenae]